MMIRTLLVSVALLTTGLAQAARLTLQEVQKENKTWVAGETSVSKLGVEEIKRMLGVPLSKFDRDVVTVKKNSSATVKNAPARFDWRNADGMNYSSPVLDQGLCGSCVAFATVATLETQMNIARKITSSPWEYSTQHLFACGGGSCEMGWWPDNAVDYLQRNGTPDQACSPYKSGVKGLDMDCSESCADSKARSQKIVNSTTPSTGSKDIEAVKAALLKGPLMTTMMVYEDFTFYKSGVYKHTTGKILGGHAVSIIGYDADQKAWIAKNSWGTSWGDQGFFLASWDDKKSGVGEDTWGYEVAPDSSYVAFDGLRDKAVLSGTATFNVLTTGTKAQTIEYTVAQGKNEVMRGAANATGIAAIDTTKLVDGVYDLVPMTSDGKNQVRGQPHEVIVLNGKFEANLKIDSVKAGDTIKDRIVMGISIAAKPVLPSLLKFEVRDSAGKTVFTKETPNIGEDMDMSFRTTNVPNGNYNLVLIAQVGSQSVESAPLAIVIKN